MILIDPWISLVSNIGILCLIPMGGIKISISFVRIEKGSIIFVIRLSRHPRSVMFTEWPFQSGSDDHLPQNSQLASWVRRKAFGMLPRSQGSAGIEG